MGHDALIVEPPIDPHHMQMIEACKGRWTRSESLLHALAQTTFPSNLPFFFADYMVYDLLKRGYLEGRGPTTQIGLPEEVRPKEP
ncbi:MAG: hypothetical protein ACHREM_26410 [Polyangiales bacterium]